MPSRRIKTLIMLFLVVATPIAVVSLLVAHSPAILSANVFNDNVSGKDRTDEQMIVYFQEHRTEFEGLLDDYGLPEQTGVELTLAEGKDIGGVQVFRVDWNDWRYLRSNCVSPDVAGQARGLWLTTWDDRGLFHWKSKGYMYSLDPPEPIVDQLAWLESSFEEGTDNATGVSFRSIGGGWYLFYSWTSS